MIASHYAEPVERTIGKQSELRAEPSEHASIVRNLKPGAPFAMLDDTLGWAWGYADQDRVVGYVNSGAIAG